MINSRWWIRLGLPLSPKVGSDLGIVTRVPDFHEIIGNSSLKRHVLQFSRVVIIYIHFGHLKVTFNHGLKSIGSLR